MFVGASVPAGDCLWFNNKVVFSTSICGTVTSSGMPIIVGVTGQAVAFDSGGGPQSVLIPDGVITFSADASVVPMTTYDSTSGSWQV
jgi:hypothetical protein